MIPTIWIEKFQLSCIDYDNYNIKYDWTKFSDEKHDLFLGDSIWKDYELDISDIPPPVFFLGVVNTYSYGFGLYIPLDMSFEIFANNCEFELKYFIKQGEFKGYFLDKKYTNFDYLINTGKIKSVRKWNKQATIDGKTSILDYELLGSNKSHGTIQAIAAECRKFMTYVKSNR